MILLAVPLVHALPAYPYDVPTLEPTAFPTNLSTGTDNSTWLDSATLLVIGLIVFAVMALIFWVSTRRGKE
jgi:hypothetical protein